MSRYRHFFRLRNLLMGGVSSVAVSTCGVFVYAQCQASRGQRASPLDPPEFAKWDSNWDKREPYSLVKRSRRARQHPEEKLEFTKEELMKKTAKATRHIVMIRHGQYNLEGETDKEHYLTQLGMEQAAHTGRRLADLDIDYDSIVSSDMTRARQTAEVIQMTVGQEKELKISEDPLLQEGAPTLPDPPVSYEDWDPGMHEFFAEGARIEAAFRKYIHRADPCQEKDTYDIIVCHGNVIRYFFCRALQFPGQAWLRMNVNHASLTIFSILPNGRVVVRCLGDSGHIPLEKISL